MDKKYLWLAILAVCVIAGCVAWIGFYDNSKRALSEDVAAFERMCPVEMAPGNVIGSVAYNEETNIVEMRIYVTNVGAVASDKEAQTDKVTLLFQAPEYRHLIKDMAKAGAGLTLAYVPGDGESIYKDAGVEYAASVDGSVSFTPEEVNAIEQKPLLSGKDRASISLLNRTVMLSGMCPMEWGEGAELVNAGIDPAAKQLCLYIRTSKIESPEYQTKLFKSELKANRREMTLVRDMVKELAAAGYGIKVCYMGEDKATIEQEIDIPASDIYNISQLH